MSYFIVDPKEDAEKDVELYKKQKEERNNPTANIPKDFEDSLNSKKYYSKNKAAKIMRILSLAMVGVGFLLLLVVTFTQSTDANLGIVLGVYSILFTSVTFFVSFNMSYTEHQKEEYDFYYIKFLEEIETKDSTHQKSS